MRRFRQQSNTICSVLFSPEIHATKCFVILANQLIFRNFCYLQCGSSQDSSKSIPHHASYANLRTAAKGGSDLCIEILRGSERWGSETVFEVDNPQITCFVVDIEACRSYNSRDGWRGVAMLCFHQDLGEGRDQFVSLLRVFCEHGEFPLQDGWKSDLKLRRFSCCERKIRWGKTCTQRPCLISQL